MDVARVIRSVVIHGQPEGNVCLPHISDILENIHNLHNFGSGNVSFDRFSEKVLPTSWRFAALAWRVDPLNL